MHLPQRLAEAWLAAQPGWTPHGRCRRRATATCAALADSLQHWEITPDGTEGWRKAEVTPAASTPASSSSQTLESRRVPGLHFIGEVVDVTGWLGGYNFQWAWASAAACARALRARPDGRLAGGMAFLARIRGFFASGISTRPIQPQRVPEIT